MAKYYLCGPFWDKDCKEFFDSFIQRIKETKMCNDKFFTNGVSDSEVESIKLNNDSVFVPGHFEVDFMKARTEYDNSSLRRLLNQVFDLDIDSINSCDKLMAWIHKLDLGSLIEIGYFIARNYGGNKLFTYNSLRKRIIFEGNNNLLNKSIDSLVNFLSYYSEFSIFDATSKSEDNWILVNGIDSIDKLDLSKKYSLAVIRLGDYDQPINALVAGVLVAIGFPFITYTIGDSVKNNVMMIASSMGHIEVSDQSELNSKVNDWINNIDSYIWSDDSINKAKEIK